MDGKWLTYTELGELMGCPAKAARARAIRRRWRRQTGNDGMARVLVPPGETLAPMRTRRVHPPVSGTGTDTIPHTDTRTQGQDGELLACLERLQAEMTELVRKLGTAEGELRAVKEDRDRWVAQADAWRTQAETAQQQAQEMLQRLTERRPGLFARFFRRAG